jgi:hypothetical protein
MWGVGACTPLMEGGAGHARGCWLGWRLAAGFCGPYNSSCSFIKQARLLVLVSRDLNWQQIDIDSILHEPQ